MKPDNERQVTAKQALQKMAHDRKAKLREFTVGQEVMTRNYRDGDKWVPGVVIERKGPLSYTIQTESGMLWRRHIDQLRELATSTANSAVSPEESTSPYEIVGPSRTSDLEHEPEADAPPEEPEEFLPDEPPPPEEETETETERSYPQRTRKTPDRYGH